MLKLYRQIINELKEVYRFRRVTSSMVLCTLKMRYKRSVLGYGWSLLGPLINYTMIGLLFSYIAKFPTGMAYLIIGTCVFSFISVGLQLGASAMLLNENYIKKIYLPKFIFPVNVISAEFVNFLLNCAVLAIVLLAFSKVTWSLSLLYVPLGILLLFLFILGFGSILSIAGVYYRDVLHIIPSLMQVLFFATPIIYPNEIAPAMVQKANQYNVFYYFIEFIRAPITTGAAPSLLMVSVCISVTILSLVIALILIKLYDNRIVFKL